MNSKTIIKEGKIFNSKSDGAFVIEKYTSCKNIDIKFINTGYKRNIPRSDLILNGKIKDRMIPSINNIGYIGGEKYNNKKNRKEYIIFKSMIGRSNCSLIDSNICHEWKNFQKFAPWCIENYIDGYSLDKDMKIPGNKIYSPDTCIFIPNEINNLFHPEKMIKLHSKTNKKINEFWGNKISRCYELIEKYPEFSSLIEKNYFYNYKNYKTGLIKEKLTNKDIYTLCFNMCKRIINDNNFSKKDKIKIFPIKRGGVPVSYIMLKIFKNMIIVDTPEESDIIIDDLIDSGKTKERYSKYNKSFYSLIDKRKESISFFITFPWEKVDEETPVMDNLVRVEQYLENNNDIEARERLREKLIEILGKAK